jgi:hypothetical protein
LASRMRTRGFEVKSFSLLIGANRGPPRQGLAGAGRAQPCDSGAIR